MKRLPSVLAQVLKAFSPLLPYFLEHRLRLGVGVAALLMVDGLQLLIPLIIRRAVNLLTTQNAGRQDLLSLALLVLGVAALMAGLRYLWRILILGHSRVVEAALRERLYTHLQTLPTSFFHKTPTGDLMARAVNDINAVRMAVGMGLVALTDGLVLGTAAVGFMLSIDPTLTLIALIPAPGVMVLARVLTRRMAVGFEASQRTFSELTERVREAFGGIRVVKSHGRESWQTEKVREAGRRYMGVNLDLARSFALFLPMMGLFTNLGLATVVGLGGRLTILGNITTGDFVAFISYLNLLTWPMMAAGWVTNLMQRGAASMRRLTRIMEEPAGLAAAPARRSLAGTRGAIRCRDLSFGYPGRREPVLRGIHLEIEPGEKVALVGRVGSGKSTLLQLIPRLWEPPPATLFLDGIDVRDLSPQGLRAQMGFVTQEVILFSGTIRENVLMGRTGFSERDVEEALEQAGFLEEAHGLAQGLDTQVGERGLTLSGGQRQRLTLARALLGRPSLLILDNALSMVDTHTEEHILNRILEAMHKSTILLVTHRLLTLSRVDRILVLEQVLLVEEGTHTELLARGGVYAGIYEEVRFIRELEEAAG